MLTEDQVIQAYRMLLGREPESRKAVEWNSKLGTVKRLREAIMRSDEFRILMPLLQDKAMEASADLGRSVLIFVHIPKCAGSTMHDLLQQAVGVPAFPERHNGLCNWPVGMLADSRFFSGHYDIASLALIPAEHKTMVTMLRDPVKRLLSAYRFLKAHSLEAVARSDQNMGLVRLARDLTPQDFFSHPKLRRHPSINNTMVRQLSGVIPQKRWDAFFPNRNHSPAPVDRNPDRALDEAVENLRQMDAFGITEQMAESVAHIFTTLGYRKPQSFESSQVLDVIAQENPLLEPVAPVSLDDELREAMEPHLSVDQKLYDHALTLFEKAIESREAT